jgi:uncharacterized membrane protein
MRGAAAYYYIFISFVLTFLYIAVRMIAGISHSFEPVVFSLLVLASMAVLIGLGENRKWAFFGSVLLFAFLVNYLVFLLLEAVSVTLVLLVVVNLIAFVVSIVGSAWSDYPKINENERTSLLKKELAELVEEKKVLENDLKKIDADSSVLFGSAPKKKMGRPKK